MPRIRLSATALLTGLVLALHPARAPLGAQQANAVADSSSIPSDTVIAASTSA